MKILLVQIDLIDMQHLPNGEFKWILHVIDHQSKFNFVFQLKNKSASDMANALQKWVFPFIGLTSILHSDNGHEFVNQLIKEVLSTWPGEFQLVSGCPRHLQSQGLVEQAHYTLKRMLSAKIVKSNSKCPPWTDWLPHIVCKYNILRSQLVAILAMSYLHGIYIAQGDN